MQKTEAQDLLSHAAPNQIQAAIDNLQWHYDQTQAIIEDAYLHTRDPEYDESLLALGQTAHAYSLAIAALTLIGGTLTNAGNTT